MYFQYPTSKILIGLGCFHYWLKSVPHALRAQMVFTQSLIDDLLTDGFEIAVAQGELSNWAGKGILKGSLPQQFAALGPEVAERILRLKANTVHLPDLKCYTPAQMKTFAKRIVAISEHSGVTEFTIHPDEATNKHWERLLTALPKEITLSVENMDCRKKNFQSIKELKALLVNFPELRFTFDIDHWLELGGRLDGDLLIEFLAEHGAALSKLHISSPSTKCEEYEKHPEIETTHYLLAGSGLQIPERFLMQLPSGLKWVIEGVIPPNALRLLKQEVDLVRQLTASTAPVERKVVGL